MCDTYSSTYTRALLKMILFTPVGKCASIFVGLAGLVLNINSQLLGVGATSFQIETYTDCVIKYIVVYCGMFHSLPSFSQKKGIFETI